jgi:ubiquinone/menaquinone biosynthesis C-methylase UbiE
VINGRKAIRDAYRDETVAREYVDNRFREPLGAMLHARQVAAIRRLMEQKRPSRVLEIAPGPGRLTVDVSRGIDGFITMPVLVEASAQMLAEARRRLSRTQLRWRTLQGDAFSLPFTDAFDLVYVFRLIRHFRAAERAQLYRQIAKVLRPGGLLAFDAINEIVSAPLRANAPDEYRHYDALMRPDVLEAELAEAGLEIVSLEGVQRSYPALARIQTLMAPRSRRVARLAIELVDRFSGGAPLEWIVTCRHR